MYKARYKVDKSVTDQKYENFLNLSVPEVLFFDVYLSHFFFFSEQLNPSLVTDQKTSTGKYSSGRHKRNAVWEWHFFFLLFLRKYLKLPIGGGKNLSTIIKMIYLRAI